MKYLGTSERKSPQRRGRWLWFVLLGLLVACVCFALFLANHIIDRFVTARDLDRAVAELDASDPGWRFEDIQERRKTLPDEQNGASQVRKVFGLLPQDWPIWNSPHAIDSGNQGRLAELNDRLLSGEPTLRLSKEDLTLLRSELVRAKAALPEARKLVAYSYGRFPITWRLDFLSTLLKDVQDSRTVVRFLAYDGLLRAYESDVQGAWTSCHGVVQTARALGDEPDFISQLVRTAELSVALQSIERILTFGEVREVSLFEIQSLLQREDQDTPALFLNALRGERALVHRMLSAYDEGKLTFEEAFRQPPDPSFVAKFKGTMAVPTIRRIHAAFLRHPTEMIACHDLPYAVQTVATQEYLTVLRGDEVAALASFFLSTTQRKFDVYRRKQSHLRSAIGALAAERYRLANGRWPENLKVLVPNQLQEIPVDPYTEDPMRMRKLADGMVVYSVGQDGVDNEGFIDRKSPVAPGSDIGFRMWDRADRGVSTVASRKAEATKKDRDVDDE
jgi:hypothetical protein